MELDLKDKRILRELDLNCRRPSSEIGKKVKLSKDTVDYRIKRMEKKGIIKAYLTAIDHTKLGWVWYRFYLKYWNITKEKEKEVINYLSKKVSWIVDVKGNWDLNFMMWSKNIYDIKSFWQDFHSKFGDIIQTHWFSIFTSIIHYPKGFILNKPEPEKAFSVGQEKVAEFDELDYHILLVLSETAREKTINIAKKLNVTEFTVRNRIKNLVQKEIIVRFRVSVDLGLLGFKYFKVHANLKNFTIEDYNKIRSYLERNPYLLYIDEMIGGADLEIELAVRETKDVYNVIDGLRHNFPGLIKDFEFLEYTKEHFLRYLPLSSGNKK